MEEHFGAGEAVEHEEEIVGEGADHQSEPKKRSLDFKMIAIGLVGLGVLGAGVMQVGGRLGIFGAQPEEPQLAATQMAPAPMEQPAAPVIAAADANPGLTSAAPTTGASAPAPAVQQASIETPVIAAAQAPTGQAPIAPTPIAPMPITPTPTPIVPVAPSMPTETIPSAAPAQVAAVARAPAQSVAADTQNDRRVQELEAEIKEMQAVMTKMATELKASRAAAARQPKVVKAAEKPAEKQAEKPAPKAESKAVAKTEAKPTDSPAKSSMRNDYRIYAMRDGQAWVQDNATKEAMPTAAGAMLPDGSRVIKIDEDAGVIATTTGEIRYSPLAR